VTYPFAGYDQWKEAQNDYCPDRGEPERELVLCFACAGTGMDCAEGDDGGMHYVACEACGGSGDMPDWEALPCGANQPRGLSAGVEPDGAAPSTSSSAGASTQDPAKAKASTGGGHG